MTIKSGSNLVCGLCGFPLVVGKDEVMTCSNEACKLCWCGSQTKSLVDVEIYRAYIKAKGFEADFNMYLERNKIKEGK